MAVIQHRRGTSAELAQQTPAAGEIFFETDTNRIKIGDGQTAYVDLAYLDNDIAISDVIDLTAQLAGKAALYHQHDIDDVAGLQEILDSKSDGQHITNPAYFDQIGATDGQVLTWSDTVNQWLPLGQAIAAGTFDGGTVNNPIQVDPGSASTAGYGFIGHAGTGLHIDSLGRMVASVAGTEAMVIDSDGSVQLPIGLPLSSIGTSGASDGYTVVSSGGQWHAVNAYGGLSPTGDRVTDGYSESPAELERTAIRPDSWDISNDGAVLAVSTSDLSLSTNTSDEHGRTRLFLWDVGTDEWVDTSLSLDGTSGTDHLGKFTKMSADGGILAVSAGAYVKLYSVTASLSSPSLNALTLIGQVSRGNQSTAISAYEPEFAISSSGQSVAVVSFYQNNSSTIRVFHDSGSGYIQRGGLVGSAALHSVDFTSVAISQDGLSVAYATPGGSSLDATRQTIYVYEFDSLTSTWVQKGSRLGSSSTSYPYLDYADRVCLAQDSSGDLLVAVGSGDFSKVDIYTWDSGTSDWSLRQTITMPSEAATDLPAITIGFGRFIDLTDDGAYLTVTTDLFYPDGQYVPGSYGTGRTWRFRLSGSFAAPTYEYDGGYNDANTGVASQRRLTSAKTTASGTYTVGHWYYSSQRQTYVKSLRKIPGVSYTLGSLTDVSEESPSQGNALVWNATSSQWEPGQVDSLQSSWPAGPYTPGTVVAEIDRKLNGDVAWTATDSTAFVAFNPSQTQTLSVGPRTAADATPLSVIDLDYGATPNSGSHWRISGGSTLFQVTPASGGNVLTVDTSTATPVSTFRGNIGTDGNLTAQRSTGNCFLYAGTNDTTGSGSFVYVARTPSAGLNVDDGIGHLVYRTVKPDGSVTDSLSIRAYVDALPTTNGCPARLETLQADDQGYLRFSQIVFSDYRRFDRIIGNVGGGYASSGLFPSYGCRAFAKVEQSGTNNAAELVVGAALSHPGSGGFSSITQLGYHSLQCNFEYAMPDTHYSVVVTGHISVLNGALQHGQWGGVMYDAGIPSRNPTTTYFTIAHGHQNSGNFITQPINYLSIAVFR